MATVTFIPYKHQAASTLGNVSAYVKQEQKTMQESGETLVSGQNCSPQFSEQEFLATRQMHRKESPIYFYHYVQSFHPDEPITGELAHKIAKEFAEKAWPESEVLIATHTDADHIHTHFIVNSVCLDSGKMLRQGPNTLRKLRPLSDELCMKHGLSVLSKEKEEQSHGMAGREYRAALKGQSWKMRLAYVIDECMKYAKTKDEFMALMESEGYKVQWQDSRKNITYTCPDGKKCRADRLHDNRYLKGAMELEFEIRNAITTGATETTEQTAVAANDGTTGAAADRSGMERTDERPVRDGKLYVGSDVDTQRDAATNGSVSEAGGFETADALSGIDTGATETGWEKERAFCFSTYTVGMPVHTSHAGDSDGSGSVLDAVVQLARAVDRSVSDTPVHDATTMRVHIDSKRLRETREKKIALGHREDDHEEEQSMQQSM